MKTTSKIPRTARTAKPSSRSKAPPPAAQTQRERDTAEQLRAELATIAAQLPIGYLRDLVERAEPLKGSILDSADSAGSYLKRAMLRTIELWDVSLALAGEIGDKPREERMGVAESQSSRAARSALSALWMIDEELSMIRKDVLRIERGQRWAGDREVSHA